MSDMFWATLPATILALATAFLQIRNGLRTVALDVKVQSVIRGIETSVAQGAVIESNTNSMAAAAAKAAEAAAKAAEVASAALLTAASEAAVLRGRTDGVAAEQTRLLVGREPLAKDPAHER